MATLTTTSGPLTVSLVEASLSRASQTVLHDVIGRADPIPVLGPLNGRRGRLVCHAAPYAAARAIETHCAGKRVTLTTAEHPGLTGTAWVVQDTSIDGWQRLSTGWAWRVTLTVTEVS